MPKSPFDRHAESYESHFLGFFDYLASLKGEFILNHTVGLKTGLEVGCGLGQITSFLNSHGKECMGVDVSPNMIKLARRQYGKSGKFQVMDAEKLKFRKDSFDFVYAVNLLHHTSNYENIVKEMRRVAKHRILICELNYKNALTWLFVNTISKKIDTGAKFIPPSRFRKPAFSKFGTHYWAIEDL